jgi:hypothetical protein
VNSEKHIRGPHTKLVLKYIGTEKVFSKEENYIGAGAMDQWRHYKENGEPQFSL